MPQERPVDSRRMGKALAEPVAMWPTVRRPVASLPTRVRRQAEAVEAWAFFKRTLLRALRRSLRRHMSRQPSDRTGRYRLAETALVPVLSSDLKRAPSWDR